MLPKILTSIFGSRNDRLLKQYAARGRTHQRARSRSSKRLDDAALRAKTDEFRQRLTPGRRARRPAARGLRRRARGRQALAEDAPLRRAADRRHRAAPGQDRRDAHRRGQDAGGHAAGVPECARRQGRARGHRQRLPGAPRRRVDGPALQLSRPHGGRQRARHGPREEKQAAFARRRHLRHQQRVRLRLPARQHGLRGRRPRGARPELRDRRRGRLDPDRRGAHAADHQRPGRRPHRDVRAHRRRRAAAEEADRRGSTCAPAKA